MKQELIPINSELWREFKDMVIAEGKRPMQEINRVLRDYMQIRKDTILFEKMRASVKGREMTDEEAVEFVRLYRRQKKLGQSGTRRRMLARNHAATRGRTRSVASK